MFSSMKDVVFKHTEWLTAHVHHDEIDPLNLTLEQSQFLQKLLQENFLLHDKYLFDKGMNELYLRDELTHHDKKIRINLKHPLIWRVCAGNPYSYRFEIIGDKLGSGYFSNVYKSLGCLAPQLEGNLLLKTSNRVIKEQDHTKPDYPASMAESEYQIGLLAPHLHCKKPTIVDGGKRSFSFLRFFKGNELFDIMHKDIKNNVFSIEQRLALTLKILYAVKDQILERGLVHLDLKPENFMFYFDDQYNPIEVNIIDVGASKKNDIALEYRYKRIVGTPEYAALEVFDKVPTDQSADVYSVGCILGLLWHAKQPSIYLTSGLFAGAIDLSKARASAEHHELIHLFSGIEGLSVEHQEQLQTAFAAMTQAVREQRPALDDVILVVENIIRARAVQATPNPLQAELDRAREVALSLRAQIGFGKKDQLTVMMNLLEPELNKLEDKPEIIAEFLATLRINALKECKNKEALLEKIEVIFLSYYECYKDLEHLRNELIKFAKHADQEQEDAAEGRFIEQVGIIEAFLNKPRPPTLYLDEMVAACEKMEKLITKTNVLIDGRSVLQRQFSI